MDLKSWYKKRGLQFVVQRASILSNRYGINSNKATTRINDSLLTLAKYGCSPTFFTPGIVVKRNSRYIQGLQEKGAEIAVHSYQHVDLASMVLDEARGQLTKAVNVFSKNGIEEYGFRCPYLSYSDELLESLPEGLFGYSSNRSIWLGIPDLDQNDEQSLFFDALHKFYNPKSFADTISVPWSRSNMIEIPVIVPDDLQLHDGLSLGSKGISQVWIEMLHKTYQRGELFNLIFHPELGSVCKQSFEDLLVEAIQYIPDVWIARLRDISDWWHEKSKFEIEVTPHLEVLKLTFNCSPRATILVRGLDTHGSGLVWDGAYSRLLSNTIEVPATPRPFIGLSDGIPECVASFLNEQGYILESGETARSCGLVLGPDVLSGLSNNVELVNYIETSPAPLVRYWRWPYGAKSSLSITGDLDALSLMDYATRVFN